ncbi:energy transducer TonB [Sphingobacterium griseoflavum]|uniref:TonB C-terminal domain-containing protein n=1 Tax=Sphingobacterium griseoflavum TaxID=1474952 RepID=A0ABQ3HVG7_9SPHI|nr:energy transducer TonB [Sphingobacterium griseoflavum]GHE38468.1 hypothetical protein GCM10017764_22310 [Sphingobacterium griseoflavum]
MKKWFVFLFLLVGLGDLYAQPVPDTSIVTTVDTYPQFRGGVRGWHRFVQQNLNVRDLLNDLDSTSYVDYGLRQTAVMEFTVCEDGRVCDVEIANKNKISPAFAEEALRVMKKSPKWTPAKKDGQGVRTRFKQSITALLEQSN